MAANSGSATAPTTDSDASDRGSHHDFWRLEVAGSGLAHLSGRYVQEGTLGSGALVASANAQVRIDGFDQCVAIGEHVVYLGARGQFSVVGQDISSTLTGAHINFRAEGSGRARLAGDGTSRLNGSARQLWSEASERDRRDAARLPRGTSAR